MFRKNIPHLRNLTKNNVFKASKNSRILTRCTYPNPVATRSYASRLSEPEDLSGGEAQTVQALISKIRETPEIKDKLDNFQVLLRDKGFNTNEPPSLMKMMGLLAQKDVKDAISDLKSTLEDNGVKMGPEELSALMKLYGFDKQ